MGEGVAEVRRLVAAGATVIGELAPHHVVMADPQPVRFLSCVQGNAYGTRVFPCAVSRQVLLQLKQERSQRFCARPGRSSRSPTLEAGTQAIAASGERLSPKSTATSSAPLGPGRRESCSGVDKAASRVQFALRCQ